jgi:hypothetical protein
MTSGFIDLVADLKKTIEDLEIRLNYQRDKTERYENAVNGFVKAMEFQGPELKDIIDESRQCLIGNNYSTELVTGLSSADSEQLITLGALIQSVPSIERRLLIKIPSPIAVEDQNEKA